MEVDFDLGGNLISDIGMFIVVELYVFGDLIIEQIIGDFVVLGQFEVLGVLISIGFIIVSGDLNVVNFFSVVNFLVINMIFVFNFIIDILSIWIVFMEMMNVVCDLRGDSVFVDNFVVSDVIFGVVMGVQIFIRNFGVSGVVQVDIVFINFLSVGECIGC